MSRTEETRSLLNESLNNNNFEKLREEDDDKIFGFIPNPLAKIQKDIQSNVDSFLSNIPLIGWNIDCL